MATDSHQQPPKPESDGNARSTSGSPVNHGTDDNAESAHAGSAEAQEFHAVPEEGAWGTSDDPLESECSEDDLEQAYLKAMEGVEWPLNLPLPQSADAVDESAAMIPESAVFPGDPDLENRQAHSSGEDSVLPSATPAHHPEQASPADTATGSHNIIGF